MSTSARSRRVETKRLQSLERLFLLCPMSKSWQGHKDMEKRKERKKEVLFAQRGGRDTQQHSKGHLLRGVGVSAEEMACSLKRLL